jgi:CubicO group peptidase (beta-lactamase class C family)
VPRGVNVFTVALLASLAPLVAPCAQPATSRQPVSRDSIDRYIEAEMERAHIPGVALAVVRAGRPVKMAGYGFADLEHRIPVTTGTVFKIGSVSKQLLATGIVLLAQDGRLSFDDPVSKYFAGTPESWNGITLRHLLTHTSGILREGPAFDPMKAQADSVVIRSAFAAPLEFPIASKYQYCNVCYFTLADVIARVSGKPWEEFLAERVFRPARMTATRTTTTTALVPHRARGYVWRDGGYVNALEFVALRPSGAFLSTVEDLARWDAELYGDRVLTRASREAMVQPMRLSSGAWSGYGFGWMLDTVDGRWRVRHGGSLPGFRAQMTRFPNDSLTVIVLTNADGAQPDRMATEVARIHLATPPRASAQIR